MIRSFARPYARAILDVAGSIDDAAALSAEIGTFRDALATSEDLRGVFATPGIELERKESLVGEIASRLGLSDLALRTLIVLTRNRRINDVGAILDALTALINEKRGIVIAEVVAAEELDEAGKSRLAKALSKRVGREVELRLSTDPTLLGGFVAKLESEVYDASVRGRMTRMRESVS
ncbi:MAG TPA: ATP synthase F1 subunit delta [Thermoanaerobaculia bacterium]|nr:ATP synthase F1 subunit delta [Thermoanaerobaculia bacterium]